MCQQNYFCILVADDQWIESAKAIRLYAITDNKKQ